MPSTPVTSNRIILATPGRGTGTQTFAGVLYDVASLMPAPSRGDLVGALDRRRGELRRYAALSHISPEARAAALLELRAVTEAVSQLRHPGTGGQ